MTVNKKAGWVIGIIAVGTAAFWSAGIFAYLQYRNTNFDVNHVVANAFDGQPVQESIEK